jgi:hypothetical protein
MTISVSCQYFFTKTSLIFLFVSPSHILSLGTSLVCHLWAWESASSHYKNAIRSHPFRHIIQEQIILFLSSVLFSIRASLYDSDNANQLEP